MTLSKTSLVLLPLLLLLSNPASALQILDAKDGETVLGKISQKEVTRISFERSRIRKVTGNAGEFVLEKDEEKGQIFIRPVSPDSTKPINLFVTSERSTVALLLQPVDTPSDTIVIREGRDPLKSASRMERSGLHVRTIKNLLLAMAADALPDDMEVREPGQQLTGVVARGPMRCDYGTCPRQQPRPRQTDETGTRDGFTFSRTASAERNQRGDAP